MSPETTGNRLLPSGAFHYPDLSKRGSMGPSAVIEPTADGNRVATLAVGTAHKLQRSVDMIASPVRGRLTNPSMWCSDADGRNGRPLRLGGSGSQAGHILASELVRRPQLDRLSSLR